MVELMDKLRLRIATQEDVDLIYEWANDDDVRRNSFNTQKIEYADHCKWYANKLESDDTFIYVMMKDEEPVGQGRLELEDNKATISYFVDGKYRGMGYGKQLLKLLEKVVREEYPDIRELVGRVKHMNIPSKKAFIACGYSEKELEEYLEYTLAL